MSSKFAFPAITEQRAPKLDIIKKVIFIILLLAIAAPVSVFSAPVDGSAAAKAEINNKLDKMAKNHEAIMKELEEIKKELYIVKIRASR